MKKLNKITLTAFALLLSFGVLQANAKTFKWSSQGDVQSLDPHTLNTTFAIGFLGSTYESLARYNEKLELIPGLAVSWTNPEPTKWVFKLRKGVKFHNGNTFNADDVIFSWNRAKDPISNFKDYANAISEIKKIDDYTIEIFTESPNPILLRDIINVYMMDKEWAEANNATKVTNVTGENEQNFANTNTNGTGPFFITERQKDVKSVFKRFDGYWGDMESNVTKIIFTPIKQDATRVAALISGEVDLILPVPLQDWKRLDQTKGVEALKKAELRTIYFGLDTSRDELLYSNIKGKNPLKDVRVRAAFAHALNLNAINKKIMRGAATPTGLLVAPNINGFVASLNEPYAYDPEKSKRLLREAGYPDGFEITLDCPNNRYINDEKICQAAANMLAKVGIKVNVLAQPKSKFFGKVTANNNYDTSFYLLGWTPNTTDSHNVLKIILSCQNKAKNNGLYNLGNYCNPRIDELAEKVGFETDQEKRQAMITEAFSIVKKEYGFLPIHQQPLSWGINSKIRVKQRPDNLLDIRYVVLP